MVRLFYKDMAERTFQIRTPNGQIKEVTETMAKQLNRQVQVVGEVVGTQFKKKDGEPMSVEDFRKKHIHVDVLPDGRKVRRIDKGFERVVEVDENSKPGQAQYDSKGTYRSRKVVADGREMTHQEWMMNR